MIDGFLFEYIQTADIGITLSLTISFLLEIYCKCLDDFTCLLPGLDFHIRLRFLYLTRELSNINEWKVMFDLSFRITTFPVADVERGSSINIQTPVL